jgi:hypothetical protein
MLANLVGIDRAVLYVLISRGFSLIALPLTLYLIVNYFSLAEQGFYYTFANILSISVFVELGLGLVLTQFASHEFAHLAWKEDGSLYGEENSSHRLISLIRKSLRIYGIISVLLLIILLPLGLFFFSSGVNSRSVNFSLPWILLVLFSVINLGTYPLLTIIEGCGKVAEVQRLRLSQSIIGTLGIWAILILHGGLYVASVIACSNFVIAVIWIRNRFRGLVLQIVNFDKSRTNGHLSWRKEILPMQWRIAVSWICGFFIYQLFNPLLFRYQNAEAAGQMGMSLTVSNIALSISVAWISTKFPTYGSLIKKGLYSELDSIAKKSTIQAFSFSFVGSIGIILIVLLVKHHFPNYGNRLLSTSAVAALLLTNMINLLTTSMAGYLRAHKEEPFLINSIVGAILISSVAWFCARYYDANVMCFTITVINLIVGLPLAVYIFLYKRKMWLQTNTSKSLT